MIRLFVLLLPIWAFATADLTVVIFGGTGDLATRKLYPAMYNLENDHELPPTFQLVSIGRDKVPQSEFHKNVLGSLRQFSRNQPTDSSWESFKTHLVYHQIDFVQESGYSSLKELLDRRNGNVIYYLATDSAYVSTIIKFLHRQGLLEQKHGRYSRVVIEKPFGMDLDSAIDLQKDISQRLEENQILRMDHYLGKAGFLKFVKFRYENPFEAMLNAKYVENVQLTISETIGIGTRVNFYEQNGHLRDVIQNHAIQVTAIAGMEVSSHDLLNEKMKFLQAIRCLSQNDVIRGQYTAGEVNRQAVPGYREEAGIPADSQIETFVQMKYFVDNVKWQGVPFYIRSGKRLPEQLTQVRYKFKANPLNLEAITITIQPNPQVLITRKNNRFTLPIALDATLERREGYENQLLAAIRGDMTGFATLNEILLSWQLFTPILNQWKHDPHLYFYKAGAWAPTSAEEQLAEDGFQWEFDQEKSLQVSTRDHKRASIMVRY